MISHLPKVVLDAQKLTRSRPELMELLKSSLKIISNLQGIERVKYVHGLIDKKLANEDFSNISCKKGCTHCCYHPISISNSEELQIVEHKQIANHDRLEKQVLMQTSNQEINYHERAFVFLSENGACSIYNDRPIICRLTNVLTPSVQCKLNANQQIIHHPVT